jgi:hypothetical protein
MPKQRVKTEQEKEKRRHRRMNRWSLIYKRRCNRRTSWYTGWNPGYRRMNRRSIFYMRRTSCRGRARKTVAPDDPTVWVGTPSVYPTLSLNQDRDAPRRRLKHRMIRRLGQGIASVYPTVCWKLTVPTWTRGLQHRMIRRSVGAVVSENLNGYVTWEGHRMNRRPGKA